MTSTKKITKIMHNWEEYEVWWVWYSTVVVTLTSGWRSSNSQTVNVTGVTSDSTIIVSPEPSSIPDYADCGVYCSAQWSGTLTFSCTSTPTNNIVVNCLVMDEGNVIVMWPQLKSYEEIIAYTDKDALLTELNTNPTEYYNKLNSEWHYGGWIKATDNINLFTIGGPYYFIYNNWIWRYTSNSGSVVL